MVHYKFTYFNGRGLGEVARQIFALAEQEYEDVRIEFSQWPELKEKAQFQKMPFLEEDGKILAQSGTINRYLAKKFGFAGKNDWEEAQIGSFGDQVFDFRIETQDYMRRIVGYTDGDLNKLKEEVLKPGADKHLAFFTTQLKKNGTGFLVGDKISWADLSLATFVEVLTESAPEILDKFPEIKAHLERIQNIPQIKKWTEKRPKIPY